MASLQARHSRSCELGKPWTPLSALDGCTCAKGPLFHVVVREGAKAHKTAVGRNLREAKRALAKVTVDVDEGGFRPITAIKFSTFADDWVKRLERKETTRDSYRATMSLAKDAFGEKTVRQLRPADIAELNRVLRDDKKQSASTRAKHLRVLHACLASAIAHGYATATLSARPAGRRAARATKSESAFFTNDEIPAALREDPGGDRRRAERVPAAVPDRAQDRHAAGRAARAHLGRRRPLRRVIHVRRTITDGTCNSRRTTRSAKCTSTERRDRDGSAPGTHAGRRPKSQARFAGATGRLWPM